jgi:hypothetical protein
MRCVPVEFSDGEKAMTTQTELREGTLVRVTQASRARDCSPGDIGSVFLISDLGYGRKLYHVQMKLPCRAGVVSFYEEEIEFCE